MTKCGIRPPRRSQEAGRGNSEFGIFRVFIPHSTFHIPNFLIPLACVLCLLGGERVSGETVNRIVAIVNDDVITTADVVAQVSSLLADRQQVPQSEDESIKLHAAVLGQIIEQRLILQDAKKMEIKVGSDEVADRLKEIRSRFPSEEEFQASLAKAQLSEEQLKGHLRDQLIVQHAVDAKVRAKIFISPQDITEAQRAHPEMAQAGERVRASHILVRVTDERPEAQARERMQAAHRQLVQGADFAQMAKRYSDAPDAGEGGSMGWMTRGQLLPELDAALFSLPVGSYSPPIRSKLGFHIVRVDERAAARELNSEEANRAVFQQLYDQKFRDALGRWLAELKRHAYIAIPGQE